ncbi:LuxR family transcriptional regulator [Streptomyces sp. SHP22-7]|nr:LuxR family transcriptional regulator [Streptomyces sp. SHP22-7]RIH58451.1 LuxR family transcriptional regulator [Streptomyces sp. SHP22-7]RIH58481.1 LuxR family transcriptional regulator [Streptomyces sp. SHP22-7]
MLQPLRRPQGRCERLAGLAGRSGKDLAPRPDRPEGVHPADPHARRDRSRRRVPARVHGRRTGLRSVGLRPHQGRADPGGVGARGGDGAAAGRVPAGGGRVTTAPVRPGPNDPLKGRPLTDRQLDVLHRIAQGQSWQQIGRDLGLTVGGVGSHSKQILRKLGAQTSAHAVFLACAAGTLDPTRRHGDHAGFAAHRYYGEEPCEACWEGERAYRRERRAARKAAQTTPRIRTS